MLLNKFLFHMSGYLKCKIIKGDNGEPYLERYMLARWGKSGEHTLFLHRFLDSDSDRGIHDHPWDSLSFILAGGYLEKRLINSNSEEKVITRNILPGTFNRIKKDDFHRIVLKPKTPTWTLFYHGPRVKHWGFQYYEILKDEIINKIKFTPYIDKTNPEEKWELVSPKGKDALREPVDYLLNSKN